MDMIHIYDIQRTAQRLMEEHGENALQEAQKHYNEVLKRQDVQATIVWMQVMDLILGATPPKIASA